MFLHRKKIQASELVLGATMSLGMVLFAVADFQVSTVSSPYGIFLVSFSVLADSVLPNYQVEVLFLCTVVVQCCVWCDGDCDSCG